MPDEKFDPSRHLTDLRGKQYLEVKWRLVWLRDVHPDASIMTEMLSHDADEAVFRASVSLKDGGSATGYGAETRTDFGDYLEKAETKALGRALAALGFGTQFCEDFDEGGAVTDSPVERSQPRQAPRQEQRKPSPNGESKSTDAQHRLINERLDAAFGDDKRSRVAWIASVQRHAVDDNQVEIHLAPLSVSEASALINELQRAAKKRDDEATAALAATSQQA